MTDSTNPFAAPRADLTAAIDAEALELNPPSLRQTEIGLSLVYCGILLVLLSIVGGLFLAIFRRAIFQGRFIDIVVIVPPIGFLGGAVLSFIGPVVCLAVPRETESRGLVVGSVLCELAYYGGSFALWLHPQVAHPLVNLVPALFGLLGQVLFLLFLRILAEYVGRFDLAVRSRNVLFGVATVVVLALLFAAMQFIAAGPPVAYELPSLIAGLLAIAALIACLVVLVMYANLVNSLRQALRADRLGHRR